MNTTIHDTEQRLRALDVRTSFIVQAPAGSGKTELLIQRFLTLLNYVKQPEEILAITFTKKSAAEMRTRIINALKIAASEPEPALAHAKKTWNLAKNVLQRNQALKWNLLDNPNQLRIQTIDSFNTRLTKHLPILSHFGATPEIIDDPTPLYAEATQELLSHLEENVAWSDAIAQLLLHMDNDLNKVQDLLINMLAKRDQWLPYIAIDFNDPILRKKLEANLTSVVTEILTKIRAIFPKNAINELLLLARFAAANCKNLNTLPGTSVDDKIYWQSLAELLFTKKTEWRKKLDKNSGFPPSSPEMKQRMTGLIEQLSSHEELRLAFRDLSLSPDHQYQESQWQTLHALYQVLRIAVAQLKITFQQHGKIDYIENAQAALLSLGSDDNPTDLILALDYKIQHILIDEFQDTSNSQYRLLEKLISGWEENDGRTLFIVGDPMQSIYRFREAEVGLFIRARKKGIGHVKLEPLILSVNFRSTPEIVNWVNESFQKVLPTFEDIATGAVAYTASVANQTNTAHDSVVTLHPFTHMDHAAQANEIIQLIQKNKQKNPTESIAILVRSRTHLEYITPALKAANLAYRAIDIDPLTSRPVIQDLISLVRALLHPADRVAWLAILRAPWCGLTLSDLLILCGDNPNHILWDQLQRAEVINQLSTDGQKRLARIIPIFLSKIADRRRYSLRLWLENTWVSLGGPACLDQSSDLEDVNTFFKLIEKLDQGGDLINFDDLDNHVKRLYASANNQADNTLQIMTIHNAKGLEFDTVILPHLERKSSSDEKQLLLWMERPRENASNALLLAPIHATGEESDSIYDYIKKQHAIKTDYEIGRLFYVAATRAKRELHLFFLAEPQANSLLDKIWPAIEHTSLPSLSSDEIKIPQTKLRAIKRLSIDWENPIQANNLANTVTYHNEDAGFRLIDNNPKFIGILIHQILQKIGHLGINWWQSSTQEKKKSYLKKNLMQLGMLSPDIPFAIETILNALDKTLQDPRGQWILKNHHDAKAEFPLTAVIENNIKSLIIDRTFVDETGTRWIIDYKTADFSAENLAEYQKKMGQYYQAMQAIESRPIRLGLYFPLVSGWKEWGFTN